MAAAGFMTISYVIARVTARFAAADSTVGASADGHHT
jgi:hypothetical protein